MRWAIQASRTAYQVSRAQVFTAALRPLTQTHRLYSTPLKLLPDVDFDELTKMLEAKSITLLDVRPKEEIEDVGMIPQSKNLILQPLGINILLSDEEFKEKVGFDKPNKHDPIVVTCLLGIRARTAQLALMAVGYTNVREFTVFSVEPMGITIFLNEEKFKEKLGFAKPGLNDAIVTTCLRGNTARTAQLVLIAAGYTNVRRYEGSFTDWLEKKGPVVFPENKQEN